ncbi:TnsD family Tn7-like transposition protein [Paenibacillus sp. FSL R5-0636]|uniref:TnsD family Tn7-like transposition protein n=1 Tax=Paenibacillus TaxID=44249 RepID=UPI0009D7300F|nr:TnsD family Tn7-like transposition protein [Paenibacillus odorifer]
MIKLDRILSFVEPFPDEDFRSIVYRYYLHSGDSEFIHTQSKIFGVRSYKQKIFPRGLQTMLNNLPIGHKFTVEKFLNEHTWFGLYKVFLTQERISQMYQNILHGVNKGSAKGQLQISGVQAILSSEIKYCPTCVINDEIMYGEVYMHREHQLSFLQICPTHLVPLYIRCTKCMSKYGDNQTGLLLKGTRCKCGNTLPYEQIEINSMHKMQIKLFNDIAFVRNNNLKLNVDTVILKFTQELFAHNFITPRGTMKKNEILTFYKTNTKSLDFKELGYDKMDMDSKYFKNNLFNPKQMVNYILFYFLLAQLLSGSFKLLTASENRYAIKIPYGNGPWACQNCKCPLYGIERISHCVRDVNDRSRIYSIRYYCDNCNHVSIIKGDDIDCIKNKINRHANNRQIVEMCAAYQEVAVAPKANFEFKLEKKRMKMIELLTNRTCRTRSELKKQSAYLYEWLMKYDKEWLESRIPSKNNPHKRKLNFSAIDRDLQCKIREAAKSISSDYHLPIRRKTILKKLAPLDRNRFRHYNRDQLPLAALEIDKYVETKKQFLIRSIPRYHLKISANNNNGMTVGQFKKKASVSFYLNSDEEVDEHIRKFLFENKCLTK